ncbi:hypothetical protein [Streptomyces sp. NPDC088350]|uniref:hypothetical protein n=1 Tax=Streptomyces sp. NPDC088350 TaxID=3365854 RepID=UPI0037FE49E1
MNQPRACRTCASGLPTGRPTREFSLTPLQESANPHASDRSKSDQDPSTWQPPASDYHRWYATDWIADKARSNLTVDPAEHAALAEVLSSCPDQPVPVVLAT